MKKSYKIPKWTIIAWFPWIWKSSLKNHNPNVLDLESSYFYWIDPKIETSWGVEQAKGNPDRIKDENWLEKYMDALEKSRWKYDYICVALFEEVLEELVKRSIPFIMIYPKFHLKDEYLWRYKARWNREVWIDSIAKVFDMHILDYIYDFAPYAHCYFLNSWEYLSDICYQS